MFHTTLNEHNIPETTAELQNIMRYAEVIEAKTKRLNKVTNGRGTVMALATNYATHMHANVTCIHFMHGLALAADAIIIHVNVSIYRDSHPRYTIAREIPILLLGQSRWHARST